MMNSSKKVVIVMQIRYNKTETVKCFGMEDCYVTTFRKCIFYR